MEQKFTPFETIDMEFVEQASVLDEPEIEDTKEGLLHLELEFRLADTKMECIATKSVATESFAMESFATESVAAESFETESVGMESVGTESVGMESVEINAVETPDITGI